MHDSWKDLSAYKDSSLENEMSNNEHFHWEMLPVKCIYIIIHMYVQLYMYL